ncbi:hypothetical protein Tcan_08503 [Toxocara canis]|uniref:Uncharacterized protein n=1 Tax=Toxocara canis TaxID=6265 RepID=A0A0B2VPE9_TOXCA|nr:hypothetical protein Tcan_08503 [Toxocara canis]
MWLLYILKLLFLSPLLLLAINPDVIPIQASGQVIYSRTGTGLIPDDTVHGGNYHRSLFAVYPL